jgi:hypothetical protein
MIFTKEVLDVILKGYHGPEDFYGCGRDNETAY